MTPKYKLTKTILKACKERLKRYSKRRVTEKRLECLTCRRMLAFEMFHLTIRKNTGKYAFCCDCKECNKGKARAWKLKVNYKTKPKIREFITPPASKICTKCRKDKPIADYHKGYDIYGKTHWCRSCRRAAAHKCYGAPISKAIKDGDTRKLCPKCGKTRLLKFFRTTDRLTHCNSCISKTSTEYQKYRRGLPEVKEKQRVYAKKWREKNKEVVAATMLARSKQYRSELQRPYVKRCCKQFLKRRGINDPQPSEALIKAKQLQMQHARLIKKEMLSGNKPNEKFCRRCCNFKLKSAFYPSGSTADSLSKWCRVCTREYHNQYYQRKVASNEKHRSDLTHHG